MLIGDIKQVLTELRRGKFDAAAATTLESLSAMAFVDDLRKRYSFNFQARTIGPKQEVGLARNVSYVLKFGRMPHSLFQGVKLFPRLDRCFLVSSYGDAISEITWADRINVRPSPTDKKGLILAFGKGFKLDKTPDGWVLKSLARRNTFLSEDLLTKWGWRFDALPPFGMSTFWNKP